MHVIAAKAISSGEALRPAFKVYASQVIKNARTLGNRLIAGGLAIVSGGTDCHMVLIDLRPNGVKGRDVEHARSREARHHVGRARREAEGDPTIEQEVLGEDFCRRFTVYN